MNLLRLIVTEFISKNNCSIASNGAKQTDFEFPIPHQDLIIFSTLQLFSILQLTQDLNTQAVTTSNLTCPVTGSHSSCTGLELLQMITIRQNELHKECKQTVCLIPSTPPILRGPRSLFHFTLPFIYFQQERVGEKSSVFSTATYV